MNLLTHSVHTVFPPAPGEGWPTTAHLPAVLLRARQEQMSPHRATKEDFMKALLEEQRVGSGEPTRGDDTP